MENKEKGFINKDKLLEYVSQEEIFGLVFGFLPEEYQYVRSPFREDGSAGCYFERYRGKLYFKDFADPLRENVTMDCFEAVQRYYGLPNFYKALELIRERLLDGRVLGHDVVTIKSKPPKRKRVRIEVETRDFDAKDKRFWQRYGIGRQQLLDDKVFAVKRYYMEGTRHGDILKRTDGPTYVFSNFREGRKKIYLPFEKGRLRFLSNCDENDIGETGSLPRYGNKLVISKSYKDCRVLRNQGLSSIWLQNEGSCPDRDVLMPIVERFATTVVLFDNDETGILASREIANRINGVIPGKARALTLPPHLERFGVSDPADMYSKMGEGHLKEFLRKNL